MHTGKTARVVAILLAVLMLLSGGALTIIKLIRQTPAVESPSSEAVSEPSSSAPAESLPESSAKPAEEKPAPTFAQLYTANLAGKLLEQYDSLCTTVHLYFPDGSSYWYTRFAAKEENGYSFHYIDADGQEESIRPDAIFRTGDGGSIQFQVAYQPEYDSDINPYITDSNAYYYEPTEEMVSCTQEGSCYRIVSHLDMSKDDYYGSNWGYTEGIAEAAYLVDAETLAIQSITLVYNGETMMETTVEYDGADVDSPMMETINAAQEYKNITIYYDYGSDGETAYQYSVPSNTAFFYSQPDGFTMYLDPEGTEPMAEADSNDARLTAEEVSLYLIRDAS